MLIQSSFVTVFFISWVIFQGTAYPDQWNGKEYAEHSFVQLSQAEYLLSNLVLRGNEKILDIGCGNGKVAALLARRVPRGFVIGVDPSMSMLTKAGKYRDINLSFLQESAESFQLFDRFDHIFAIHVLQWIEDQEQALRNMYHHLKPGGQTHFILTPSKEGLPFHEALVETLDDWREDFLGFVDPQKIYDIEYYRQLLVNVGFHIESIHYVFHQSLHDNKKKLRMWIKQWLPHGKYLSKDKQDVFLEKLIDKYLTKIGHIGGKVEWDEYVLIIEGKRM